MTTTRSRKTTQLKDLDELTKDTRKVVRYVARAYKNGKVRTVRETARALHWSMAKARHHLMEGFRKGHLQYDNADHGLNGGAGYAKRDNRKQMPGMRYAYTVAFQ